MATSSGVSGSELRHRLPRNPEKPQQAESIDVARDAVVELNSAEEGSDKDEKEKRTFGRTPDGTVFTVPQTHDMVSQLLFPNQPKNLSDLLVVLILGLHILAVVLLPRNFSMPLFGFVFLLWRTAYNGGIGFVLREQSLYNSVVDWAKKSGIFMHPSTGKNRIAHLYPLLKREMETKIPRDYKFDEAPVEYNTWLLFRRICDLILMCDFVSYCCFAAACGGTPEGEHIVMTITRWTAGVLLVLFNLWVKLDAHRVVKDFAWYWGDFFFLMDQELTFDGVFEMAPHPMYSVGYAGFYGISLMAASQKVLFISIIAHAAQFAFLALVENPHIEKTYNHPPLRRRTVEEQSPGEVDLVTQSESLEIDTTDEALAIDSQTATQEPSHVRNIIGLQNLDLHRTVDVGTILLQFYIYSLAFLTPSSPTYQTFFILNAIAWRLWYSLGVGYLLDRQSKKKKWTRHFIKYGENTEESWRQWKGVYHISMTMCYVSFVVAAYKMYHLPPDWEYGMVLLRHVLGVALIALQLWTVFSIYQSLGEFGWFFGDFFFEHGPKLTYSGIYRFLNQPERVIGLAGVWGFAIITWSKAIFFLALLSHALSLCFIHFVERPHMQRRYGQRLRQSSGLSKSVKRSLPSPLRKWQGTVDRALEDGVDFVEDVMDSARAKLAASVDTFVKDVKALFKLYPGRVSITRLAPDLAGFDVKDYSLQIEGIRSARHASIDHKTSDREGDLARHPAFRGAHYQPVTLEYGAPIKVRWTAPLHHSKKDWIGLYMLADNASRDATRVSSQGRWVATSKGAYDSARPEQGQLVCDKQNIHWDGHGGDPPRSPTSKKEKGVPTMTGEVEFSGDKLWWTTGLFEFRYHHDGKHNVMALSQPFEVRIGRFEDYDLERSQDTATSNGASSPSARAAVEAALLPVVRNCFDRDSEIAPNTVEEAFGSLVEREGKFAKRVVFAVWQMFGIELAPSVVKADGNVRNLAWRVCSAKRVLAPYSMSSPSPKGPSTPTEEDERKH